MAPNVTSSSGHAKPPSAAPAGASGGGVHKIVALHLFFDDERGVMTYRESGSTRRRLHLCRVAVHRRRFAELLAVVPSGLLALSEWLDKELARLAAAPATPKNRKEKDNVLVRRVLAKLVPATKGALETSDGRSPSAERRLDPRIQGVITLLERVCDEEVSPEFAAKNAHLSKTHFLRLFRQGTGMTYRTFVERLRVHVAAAILLDEPFERITDIAFRAGPWDLRTFERAFKRVFGCTPRQYQARHLNDGEA
jgi:AraC-like DNA-binding protein